MYRAEHVRLPADNWQGWAVVGPRGHLCRAVDREVALETARLLNELRGVGHDSGDGRSARPLLGAAW